MILGSLVSSAAGGIVGAAKGIVSAITSIGKGRDMNPARLAYAQLLVVHALEGGPLALTAARGALGGAEGKHLRPTPEGNSYFAAAWQTIQQYAPALAAEAQRLGGTAAPEQQIPQPQNPAAVEQNLMSVLNRVSAAVSQPVPTLPHLSGVGVVATPSALQVELQQLVDDLKARTADSVLRIGSGATTQLANQVAPDDGRTRVAVPVDGTTLFGGMPAWLPWAGVAALVLVLVVRR